MNFFENLEVILSFSFLQRALIVGLVVSLCASLLGVSLVLKRYAMIGTSLSHVGFAAMTGAMALGFAPVAASLPIVVVAAFFLLRLNENSKIKGDSAVALVSASSLAVGVIIFNHTMGPRVSTCNAMFGNILAMSEADMRISVAMSVVVMILFVLFYRQIFAVTYDEDFARATGTKVELYKSLLAVLTALTVILGMQMMGALLISSLIVFPALTAMRICKSFLSVIVVSAVVAVFCFFVGFVLAFGLDLTTGASVVGVNMVVFALFSGIAFIRGSVLR